MFAENTQPTPSFRTYILPFLVTFKVVPFMIVVDGHTILLVAVVCWLTRCPVGVTMILKQTRMKTVVKIGVSISVSCLLIPTHGYTCM